MLISITDLPGAELPAPVVVIAHATDWPQDKLHEWLAAIRAKFGPRKPVLAVLPGPPESYPAETQALWTRAFFGFGFKVGAVLELIEDYIAGRA